MQTNADAPNGRVVYFDLPDADPGVAGMSFTDVIPEDPNALLEGSRVVNGDYLLLNYKRNIQSEVWLCSLSNGQRLERIAPDFIGRIELTALRRDWTWFGATLTSFTLPGSHYHYDFERPAGNRWTQVLSTSADGLDPDDFVVEQKWFSSRDGTRVPMFIIRHVRTPLDGTAPAWQYGASSLASHIGPETL